MWARKLNKQFEIPVKEKSKYLAMGYTIKDDKGKTIATPEENSKELVTSLKKEISTLKGQITVLKKTQAKE